MDRPLAILALLLGVSFAGCAGDAGTSGADDEETPAPGEGIGGLSGLIVDEERRPVAEALVSLTPGDRNTLTTPEGRFVFAKIPDGNYTLNVTANGYYGRDQVASVAPGRTTVLTIILIALPTDLSFHETFHYTGLQQCMLYTSVYLAHCSYPYTLVYYSARDRGVNLSQYGAPPDVMTNRYRTNFSVREDHTGIVSELIWRAVSDASRYYVLQLSCAWYNPTLDDCVPPGRTTTAADTTYAKPRGVSPLRVAWSLHDDPQWMKWGPWIMSRAYLSGPADRPAGAALDQRIDMYNTVFYGAEPPRDWSIVDSS